MHKVITAPVEIITVADAAAFMRAEFSSAEEDVIEAMITAARQWCENYLGRAIGVQTLELRIDGFPPDNGPIPLRPPYIDIVSIKYLDPDQVETTMDEADFVVSDAEPATIVPVDSWPETFDCADSVRVRYQAGYSNGESPRLSEDPPKTIRTAMLMLVADMFANREAQVEKVLAANPTFERLLSTYRLELGI